MGSQLARGEHRVFRGHRARLRHNPRGRVHVEEWQGAAGRILVLRQDQGPGGGFVVLGKPIFLYLVQEQGNTSKENVLERYIC